MKISKTRFFIILAIGVTLVLGTSYLFMALAQTEKSEPALPSTAAIAPEAPSLVANSPTPPPGEPEKPPPPTHYGPAAKQPVTSRGAYLSYLGSAMPDKVEGYAPPQYSYEGVLVLEGGETCGTAVVISVPHNSTGYTCDNADDYEEQYVFDCPYSSNSPDVVYSYSPSANEVINVDLGGSSYDTKVFVYENTCESAYLVGCNDDYYPDYTSAIIGLPVYSGNTYYIVVDGYGGDCGDYLLNVTYYEECDVVCPPGGIAEAEPICEDDWEDIWNGGCNSDPPYPFEDVNCGDTICGTSGTYLYYGSNYRDTDWFRLVQATPTTLVFKCVAEFPLLIFVINGGTEDCLDYTILGNTTASECDTAVLSFDVPAGVYWLWVGPSVFTDVPCGKEYVAIVDCEVATTGACCNDFEPYDCQITTPEDCAAVPDHTFMGLGTDCDPNPCLPAPPNDECENAIQISLPDCPSVHTEYGTTVGATIDCPGVLDWEAVWYKFELTYACNNVLIDYCPTNRDDVYTRGVVLYDECPADCPNYILYSGASWVTCPSSYTDLTVWWNALPAGTYWLPVYVEDASGNQLDFGFDICVEECFPEPGDNCATPVVVDLNKSAPGDTLYADYSQTTCGRVDDYDATCLGYYDGGEDIIYQVNVTTAVDVNIKMDPKGTTYGGIAIDNSCPPDADCIAYTTGYSGPYTLVGVHLEPGTYYIMVDTWPAPDCIPDFDLFIIESEGATSGDNCSDPALVTLPAEMPYTDINYTCGRVDDYDATCLGYYDGGEDKIYEVTVTSAVNVQVTMDPYGTTWTGIVLDDACPPDPSTCLYTSTNSSASPHGFVASLSAGTYYIQVDTWPSPDCIPEFELEIIEAPEGPENDTCQGAPIISTFPTTVFGTTVGATIDCPGVLDWDAVWYRFDVPYESNNILVDYCPTDGYIYTVGIVLYDECPPDCPGYIIATGYSWVYCEGTGYDNPNIWWNEMPGPASYWFPVYVVPGKAAPMDFGFTVSVEEVSPCSVFCPDGGIPEDEPWCEDDWEDIWNGGCNSSPYVFEDVNCGDTICGTSGTYLYYGSNYRDTDWFRVEVGDGDMTFTCEAEFDLQTILIDAGSENCVDYAILDYRQVGKCVPATITWYCPAGVYWLWVGPTNFSGVPCGSDYVMTVDCVPFGPQIAVDPTSMYPVLNPSGDCSTADEDLVISSVGGEDLVYSIVENPAVDWMELSSYGGTIPAGNSHTLTTSFDATGMAAGDYYCDLEITHNDPGVPSPFVVTVHLEVELAPEIGLPVRLWVPVVPDCETVQPLRVVNSGEGTLSFEISVSQNPPAPAAGKSSIRENLKALEQARKSEPSLTPREAARTLGAKKSAIEYHSTGASEGLLFTAGAGMQVEILVVDDDGGLPNGSYSDIEYAYLDALDANALVYDYYLVDWIDPLANGPDLSIMQNYSCIIWFTGETWGYYGDDTVTDTDENNLAAFLDGGGNLFLSAQDYLWESYPSAGSFSPGQFPYDYLGVGSVIQDAWNDDYTVYGGAGSVADGMQFDADRCFATNPDVPLWTDVLYGQGSFLNVFLIYETDPSAVQYDGGSFKTVFTTTEFCGLLEGTPSYRADLMASIMDWFGCGAGGPACPFIVDPEAGEVPPESFFDVSLTFDGTLFEECVDETLTCYLSVASNDCDEPLLTVDIHALSARGDVTADCTIDIADVVFLLNYVFTGSPAPNPMCIGDVDRDGDVDSDDALYLISYLFEYGPPPEIPAAPLEDQTPIQLK